MRPTEQPPSVEILLTRNRLARSTWTTADRVFEQCLFDGTPERALPIIDWLKSDAWLATSNSKFYSWAVAIYVQCGRTEDAIALLQQALRYGYRNDRAQPRAGALCLWR